MLRYVFEWFGIILLFGFIIIMCNTKLTEEDVYLITFVWAICRICEKLEDLINDFIMSLEFSEHVLDIKVIENKRFEETGIYYSKEGNWKREEIYYAAYICVGGKIYV